MVLPRISFRINWEQKQKLGKAEEENAKNIALKLKRLLKTRGLNITENMCGCESVEEV